MIAHVTNAVADSDLQIRDKGGGGKGGSGHPDPEIRGGVSNKFDNTRMLSKLFFQTSSSSSSVLSQYCQVTSNITKGYSCGQLLGISRVGPARESSLFDHLINPLLTKLARSRML